MAWRGESGLRLYGPTDPLTSLGDEDKVRLLERIEADLQYAESNSSAQSQLRSQNAVSALDLQTAEYELKKLNIARKNAARALRYTKVQAPFAGRKDSGAGAVRSAQPTSNAAPSAVPSRSVETSTGWSGRSAATRPTEIASWPRPS